MGKDTCPACQHLSNAELIYVLLSQMLHYALEYAV